MYCNNTSASFQKFKRSTSSGPAGEARSSAIGLTSPARVSKRCSSLQRKSTLTIDEDSPRTASSVESTPGKLAAGLQHSATVRSSSIPTKGSQIPTAAKKQDVLIQHVKDSNASPSVFLPSEEMDVDNMPDEANLKLDHKSDGDIDHKIIPTVEESPDVKSE